MSKCDDTLELARRNPKGLRFEQVIYLAECWKFERRTKRRGGSHHIYKRPGLLQMLNFQPDQNGMAKAPQVRQLLEAIRTIEDDEEVSK